MKSSKKEHIPVEYPTNPEEFKNYVEEKEVFLYASKINAAKNFSKHL
ncbi:MAG: hypothetical protein J5708_06855 [Bacteroidales bacterium]|nr:hypothetical protein [Bacteroidales bacterium]